MWNSPLPSPLFPQVWTRPSPLSSFSAGVEPPLSPPPLLRSNVERIFSAISPALARWGKHAKHDAAKAPSSAPPSPDLGGASAANGSGESPAAARAMPIVPDSEAEGGRVLGCGSVEDTSSDDVPLSTSGRRSLHRRSSAAGNGSTMANLLRRLPSMSEMVAQACRRR